MSPAEVLAAIDLPPETLVDQRVAKKLLVENGAVTSSDKRRINEGVEKLTWVAALKPAIIGVPPYSDAVREYLEIAVLSLELRPESKPSRLVELVHRAIPYPVLLVTSCEGAVTLSVAHKRHAQNEADRFVLEAGVVEVELPGTIPTPSLLAPLRLATQPKVNLLALYQGWLECLEAIAAARITGRCTVASDAAAAAARRDALVEYDRLTREIAQLRRRAQRETQLHRRVELNLEIKRLEAAQTEARSYL